MKKKWLVLKRTMGATAELGSTQQRKAKGKRIKKKRNNFKWLKSRWKCDSQSTTGGDLHVATKRRIEEEEKGRNQTRIAPEVIDRNRIAGLIPHSPIREKKN